MDARRADAITGSHLEKLSEAMRSAFPGRPPLEMFLKYQLDKPGDILMEGTLDYCIYKLLVTAQSQGWLHELIDKAIADKPGNAKLSAWADEETKIAAQSSQAEEEMRTGVVKLTDTPYDCDRPEATPDNLISLDERRRYRRTGQLSNEWESLAKALREARFDTSDWRAMASSTYRLREELVRPRPPHPDFPDRVDLLIDQLTRTLSVTCDESASKRDVRSAGEQCDRVRNWLLNLLTQSV
jgi:hypothetical protein